MTAKILVLGLLAAILLPAMAAAFVPSYLQVDPGMTRTTSDVVYEVPFPGWPGGIVPYVISGRFRASDVELLHQYMEYIMNNSCVRFVERSNQTAFLDIVTSMDEAGSENFSFMYTGERSVMIVPPPALPLRGPSVMLLMLGFAPEHTRGDRDEHIYFNCSQCPDNFKMMMQKRYKMSVDLKYPYDGKSMTHIGTDEVKQINAVMWALDPSKTSFNPKQEGMSEIDLMKLNYFYNCSSETSGGSSGAGDGSSGAGDGSTGAGDGSTGADNGSTGAGDGSTGAGDGSAGAGDGSSGAADGSAGAGNGSAVVAESLSGAGDGLSGAGDGLSGAGDGSSGASDGSSGAGDGSSGTAEGSPGMSNSLADADNVDLSGISSGSSTGYDNDQNKSDTGTAVGVNGTAGDIGSSGSISLGLDSGLGVGTSAGSSSGSDGGSPIAGSSTSNQAIVDPVSILGGTENVWNGAVFINKNETGLVVPVTYPPLNYSMMIISPLNSADKFATSVPMFTVSGLLLQVTLFFLFKCLQEV